MRIGEILIRSGLINSQQLEEALQYASYKHVPVGRALRVLRHLDEDDLSRTIEAQIAIKKGLEAKQAVAILKLATQAGRTFNYALENAPLANKNVSRVLIDFILNKYAAAAPWHQPAKYEPGTAEQAADAGPAPPRQDPRSTGSFPAPSTQNPRSTGSFPAPSTQNPRSTGSFPAPSTQNPRSTGSFPAPSTQDPRSTGSFPAPSTQNPRSTGSFPAPSTQDPRSTGSFATPTHRPVDEKPAAPPAPPAKNPAKKSSISLPSLKLPLLGGKPSAKPNEAAPNPPVSEQKQAPTFEELIDEGDRYFMTNQLASAEKAYLAAREIAVQNLSSKPTSFTAVLIKMANMYLATDHFSKAEPIYEQVLKLQETQFGDGSAQVTRAYEDLAELYDMQNQIPAARKHLEAALNNYQKQQQTLDYELGSRLLKRLIQLDKRAPLKSTRTRLGELAVDAQLLSPVQMQAAVQSSKQTGAALGSVLRTMNFLDAQQVESVMFAQLLVKQGTLPAAVAVHAIRIATSHQIPLRQMCEAGKFLSDRESNDFQYQQLVLEQENLLAAEARLGANHPEVAKIAQKVADIHLARKDRVAAELLYKRAISIMEKSPNADKLKAAQWAERLADIYCQVGRHAEAQPLLLKSLEFLQTAGRGETTNAASTLWKLAKVELSQYNQATALSFLRTSRSIYEKLSPMSTPKDLLDQMLNCCLELNINNDLEPILKQLIAIAQKDNRSFAPDTARYLEQLGDIYVSSGRNGDAQEQFQSAMQIHKRSGAQSDTRNLLRKLEQASGN